MKTRRRDKKYWFLMKFDEIGELRELRQKFFDKICTFWWMINGILASKIWRKSPTFVGDQGPNLQNFVKWTFVILSQFFRISFICQLISYRMKILRKNYERDTKKLRNNYDVDKYLFVNKMAHMCILKTNVSKNRLLLHDLSDDRLHQMTQFPRWADNKLIATRELRIVYKTICNSLVTFLKVHFTKCCKLGPSCLYKMCPKLTHSITTRPLSSTLSHIAINHIMHN